MGIICFYGYFRKRQQLRDYVRQEAEAFKSSNEERFNSQCTLRGLLRAGQKALHEQA